MASCATLSNKAGKTVAPQSPFILNTARHKILTKFLLYHVCAPLEKTSWALSSPHSSFLGQKHRTLKKLWFLMESGRWEDCVWGAQLGSYHIWNSKRKVFTRDVNCSSGKKWSYSVSIRIWQASECTKSRLKNWNDSLMCYRNLCSVKPICHVFLGFIALTFEERSGGPPRELHAYGGLVWGLHFWMAALF